MNSLLLSLPEAVRQRALLNVLVGDFIAAAQYLAAAPGLGWSDCDHPGTLLFAIFAKLWGVGGSVAPSHVLYRVEPDFMEDILKEADEPRLIAPTIDDLLELAGVDGETSVKVRQAVLTAMREAAEKRVQGVIEHKRRRRYGHAAGLVATCAKLEPSAETDAWIQRFRTEYRRYSAFQRELKTALG